eukprot:m.52673 g.52673  ORF g.52673 m.52673 type:complete len:1217 (+) comp11325_c0_seq1:133-3783(+)
MAEPPLIRLAFHGDDGEMAATEEVVDDLADTTYGYDSMPPSLFPEAFNIVLEQLSRLAMGAQQLTNSFRELGVFALQTLSPQEEHDTSSSTHFHSGTRGQTCTEDRLHSAMKDEQGTESDAGAAGAGEAAVEDPPLTDDGEARIVGDIEDVEDDLAAASVDSSSYIYDDLPPTLSNALKKFLDAISLLSQPLQEVVVMYEGQGMVDEGDEGSEVSMGVGDEAREEQSVEQRDGTAARDILPQSGLASDAQPSLAQGETHAGQRLTDQLVRRRMRQSNPEDEDGEEDDEDGDGEDGGLGVGASRRNANPRQSQASGVALVSSTDGVDQAFDGAGDDEVEQSSSSLEDLRDLVVDSSSFIYDTFPPAFHQSFESMRAALQNLPSPSLQSPESLLVAAENLSRMADEIKQQAKKAATSARTTVDQRMLAPSKEAMASAADTLRSSVNHLESLRSSILASLRTQHHIVVPELARPDVSQPLLTQHATKITAVSSEYGTNSYSAQNLIGEHRLFPRYGDFSIAMCLGSYGPWWKKMPSSPPILVPTEPVAYQLENRTRSRVLPQDFVEFRLEEPVFISSVAIYETYHPGTIVRILALPSYLLGVSHGQLYQNSYAWTVLWEGAAECETLPAMARKFSPPLSPCTSTFATHLLRIEFDTRKVAYHTELDGAEVIGRPVRGLDKRQLDALDERKAPHTIPSSIPTTTSHHDVAAQSNPTHCGPSAQVSTPQHTIGNPPHLAYLRDLVMPAIQAAPMVQAATRWYRSSIASTADGTQCTVTEDDSGRNDQSTSTSGPGTEVGNSRSFRGCQRDGTRVLDDHGKEDGEVECDEVLSAEDDDDDDGSLCHSEDTFRTPLSRPASHLDLFTTLRASTPDMSPPCQFDLIPDEIVANILGFLPLSDQLRFGLTNTRFLDVVSMMCGGLECLDLQQTWEGVDDHLLDLLAAHVPSMTHLSLSWTSQHFVSAMGALNMIRAYQGTLVCLRLSACTFVDDTFIELLVSACPGLAELDVQYCTAVSEHGLTPLQHMTHLTRLNISGIICHYRTLQAVFNGISALENVHLGNVMHTLSSTSCRHVLDSLEHHAPTLKSLVLWRARTMLSPHIRGLVSNCPQLEELDLGWCRQGTQRICGKVAESCPRIRKLFLTASRQLDDVDVAALATCQDLEQVDLLGASLVSAHAIEQLLESCKKLQLLDISFCRGISADTVTQWREAFPNVCIQKSFSS